jgi:hypothetical protein
MNKTKSILRLAISIAIVFTFSCSSGSDGGGNNSDDINRNGSRKITEVYALKDITDKSFTFIYIDTIPGSDYCGVSGILKRKAEVYDVTMDYIINNKTLVWQYGYDDGLQFRGTSDNLVGTWTRGINKYGDFENVTKAEFIGNELKVTYDYCAPDRIFFRYGEDRGNGWKIRNVNCETYEIYKGNEAITVKETSSRDVISTLVITYKGKTCGHPISYYENACSEAWKGFLKVTDIAGISADLLEELFEIFLEQYSYFSKEQDEQEFAECLVNTIPYTEVPRGDYKSFLWGF